MALGIESGRAVGDEGGWFVPEAGRPPTGTYSPRLAYELLEKMESFYRRQGMSLIRKLMWWKRGQPAQRIRVCIECGMPVGEHKEWCAIYKVQQADRYRPVESAGNK